MLNRNVTEWVGADLYIHLYRFRKFGGALPCADTPQSPRQIEPPFVAVAQTA